MGIKVEGIDDVKRFIEREAKRRVEEYVRILKRVGRETVKGIRDSDFSNWDDQTGNLRSSIGFIIVHDGNLIQKEGFVRVDGPKRDKATSDGSVLGIDYAESLARQYPKGYALIIVAGMDYAAYVEDIKGKQVLTGGELFANNRLAELMEKYRAELRTK